MVVESCESCKVEGALLFEERLEFGDWEVIG